VAGHTVADLPARSSGSKGGKGSGNSSGGGAGGGGSGGAASIPVLLLIDTAGCGFEEQKEEEGDST